MPAFPVSLCMENSLLKQVTKFVVQMAIFWLSSVVVVITLVSAEINQKGAPTLCRVLVTCSP